MADLNMLKMRFQLWSLLLASSFFVSGCVPVMLGGGMVAGGYTAMRDKKIGDSLNDSKIDLEIKNRLYRIDRKLQSDVSAIADHGSVLLTGVVSNPEWVDIAEKEAWAVNGVLEVNNHITIGEFSATQLVKDDYLTTACKTALLCEKTVRSVNYKIKTYDSVVYVLGISRTEEELRSALSAIQRVKGIKKVVSYVKLI